MSIRSIHAKNRRSMYSASSLALSALRGLNAEAVEEDAETAEAYCHGDLDCRTREKLITTQPTFLNEPLVNPAHFPQRAVVPYNLYCSVFRGAIWLRVRDIFNL